MPPTALSTAAVNAIRDFQFVICARGIEDGKFRPKAGKPRFLKVPRGTPAIPACEVSPGQWLRELVDLADGSADGVISPTGDVLVFVHGYNNSAQELSDRHRILQDSLLDQGWRGVVVSYDWPSDDSTLNYYEDRKDAAATAQFLVTHGIGIIQSGRVKHGCETNIHLLGHSTGAYVIMEGFSAAQKNKRFYKDDWRIGQVAFIGGDVSCASLALDSDWNKPMFDRIMRLTNYSNGFDDVLAVSNAKRLGAAPRAGRVGLGKDPHPQSVNVDCSGYFRSLDPDSQRHKVGWWNHSWHIGNPDWTCDLALTLEGRYDRGAIPTRERRDDALHLVKGGRPAHEARWRELVTDYARENPALIRRRPPK